MLRIYLLKKKDLIQRFNKQRVARVAQVEDIKMTINLDRIKVLDEDTYLKALRAVKRKRVVKFKFIPSELVLWGVYSERRERVYIVIPDLYCSCTGFLMNVIMKRRKEYCYHMVAQKIAEKTGVYGEEILSDEEYLSFLGRMKKYMTSIH